jgi:hypothetical protein
MSALVFVSAARGAAGLALAATVDSGTIARGVVD